VLRRVAYGASRTMGWDVMLDHVKVICFSVGLLLVLSGLNNVSFALRSRTVERPAAAQSAPR